MDRGLRANFVFNTIKDASEANRFCGPEPSTLDPSAKNTQTQAPRCPHQTIAQPPFENRPPNHQATNQESRALKPLSFPINHSTIDHSKRVANPKPYTLYPQTGS